MCWWGNRKAETIFENFKESRTWEGRGGRGGGKEMVKKGFSPTNIFRADDLVGIRVHVYILLLRQIRNSTST